MLYLLMRLTQCWRKSIKQIKQIIYNDIASCKMMLETTIGQSSELDEEEQGEEPLNLATQVPPPMSSTEI